jgi:hypothetical protein
MLEVQPQQCEGVQKEVQVRQLGVGAVQDGVSLIISSMYVLSYCTPISGPLGCRIPIPMVWLWLGLTRAGPKPKWSCPFGLASGLKPGHDTWVKVD